MCTIYPGGSATCGATARSTGKPCTKAVAAGGKRCRYHGGASPQAKAATKQRRAEAKAREALGRLDVQPVENPLTELQQLAGRAVAWMNLMESHVADLKATRYGGENGENVRGEVQLFERAMDRCVTLLSSIARLGIDERLTRVSEQQVAMVDTALTKSLAERGMSRERQREVRAGVARHLRVAASALTRYLRQVGGAAGPEVEDRQPARSTFAVIALADRLESLRIRRWASPLDLACDLDPTVVRTPALELINTKLVALVDGGSADNRLLVAMPPQEGKSILCSKWFPLWLLASDPDPRIAVVSHSDEMARRWGGDI